METLYTNGTHQKLTKIALSNTISIQSGKKIHCQKCFCELVRPCKNTNEMYKHFNNSICMNRCLIFPHGPNFFCNECWEKDVLHKIYKVVTDYQNKNAQ